MSMVLICGRCSKPVERCSVSEHFDDFGFRIHQVALVECHGESQVVTVEKLALVRGEPIVVFGGDVHD